MPERNSIGPWLALRAPLLLLGLVMGASLLVRMHGIRHGYPDYVGTDERLIVKEVVHFFDDGTLRPSHYNYPAFYSYLYAGAMYGCRILGGLDSVAGLQLPLGFALTFNAVLFALVGRWLSLLAGVALVGLTYLLGCRAYGRWVGLGGAIFAACSTTLVGYSRLALPEMTMALLATGACYCWVDIAERGRRTMYLAGGLLAGLAISTKYNAGLVLAGLAVAHLLRWRRERPAGTRIHLDLGLALGAAALAFLAGSPYWALSFGEYHQALLNVQSNTRFSSGAEVAWPWLLLLKSVWTTEMAWGVVATLGCGYAAWRRQPADWVLLAVLLGGFIYVGSWQRTSLHYLICLAPLAGLLGARLVLDHLRVYCRVWGVALLGLVSLPNAWRQAQQGQALAGDDLNLRAARWIEEHIPNGAVIGGYWLSYLPPLKGIRQQEKLQSLMAEHQQDPRTVQALRELAERHRYYRCMRLHYFADEPQVPAEYSEQVDLSDPKTRRIFTNVWLDYDQIHQFGVEYVLLSSAAYGRFFTGESPPMGTPAHYFHTRSREFVSQFFDESSGRYELVADFTDGQGQRVSLLRVLPSAQVAVHLEAPGSGQYQSF
ncbi:MAG: glycosyltransferase family 39 protein [Candidatus Handelsmanbacteria bacterium]|nr:glycosyltransferase family 39 protein [Candidatus Handelsmanbacteria bacterium]